MDRIIEVKVFGNHITKDNKYAGVRGEANVTQMRITFDESWRYFAKKITFFDAYGGNSVSILLNVPESTESIDVFLVPIPKEPLTYAGTMSFVLDGISDNKIQRSVCDELEVKDSPKTDDAVNPVDPESTEFQQLQKDVANIIEGVQGAFKAKESIQNMTVSCETLPAGENAFVNKGEYDGVVNLHYGIPEGKKGDTGDSGVYIGEEAPTDPRKNVWINPNGSATEIRSAYEVAVENGFEGTVEEWLASLHGENYELTPTDLDEIAEIVEQYEEKTVILTASGWSGTSAPYTQSVSVAGITSTTQGLIYVADSATDEQYNAAAYAMLRKSAQTTDGITIKAYGTLPTVDIPLTVRIGG